MYYDLQAHMRSLEALNITGQQYGVVLTPLVLSRLPPDLRLEWAREGELHESDLGYLLDFLQRELERRERSQTFAMECVTSKAWHTRAPPAALPVGCGRRRTSGPPGNNLCAYIPSAFDRAHP